MTVQVALVRKPLMSAAKLAEGGNEVILNGSAPHIRHLKSGKITKLKRQGMAYTLDLWTWVPSPPQPPSGFTRR